MSVLVLGSGFVVEPLIRYLTNQEHKVTVASRTLANIEKITNKYKNASAIEIKISEDNTEHLENLIESHTIVISMLPYIHHKIPFDLCLKHKKHFLSTSYTQDHMKERLDEVVANNMIVVNEAGIYPGLETASIMKVVDQLQETGHQIKSLTTFCGGLPAPDANDNPFGYKFSWAPRGVLLAERNGATFLENGNVLTFDTRADVMTHTFWEDFGGNIGKLEGIANRDSLKFVELYRIEGIDTFIRGSLRFPGWTDIVKFMYDANLLDIEENPNLPGQRYLSILARNFDLGEDEVEEYVSEEYPAVVHEAMDFLGVFDEETLVPDGLEQSTVLDAMAALMKQKMQYREGERDMIPMIHHFEAVHSETGEMSFVTSKAVFYGNENGTAMENTVSLPVAVVAHLILTGMFDTPGVHILNMQELYQPILDYMESQGYKYEVTFQ